jgi:integrase/recombinase XerD
MLFASVPGNFEMVAFHSGKQRMNMGEKPVDIDIALHPDLAEIIAATASAGARTFLATEYGKTFSPNGFGNKFRDWCDQAGLPHCSAHGLRKAIAARLSEQEASAHEIMAVTGSPNA